MSSPLSVVYNITSQCPYNCVFCVISGGNPDSTELDIRDKRKIIENLIELNKRRNIQVDISGGEPLSSMEHLELIEMLANAIGKERISISLSGAFLSEDVIQRISKTCNDVEISLDTFPSTTYILREYSNQTASVEAIKMLKSAGITVGVSSTLTKEILNIDVACDFYLFLAEMSVDYWSILRFMPVGRAITRSDLFVSQQEWESYRDGMLQFYIRLKQGKRTDIKFHYTLSGHKKHEPYCRCVNKSIGILPNGLVTACFWGIDENRAPLYDEFILGYTPKQSLIAIMDSPKADYWLKTKHKCILLNN